jgi:hypothetical protein
MEHAFKRVHWHFRCSAASCGYRRACAVERISRSSVSEGRTARVTLARMRVRSSNPIPNPSTLCFHLSLTMNPLLFFWGGGCGGIGFFIIIYALTVMAAMVLGMVCFACRVGRS